MKMLFELTFFDGDGFAHRIILRADSEAEAKESARAHAWKLCAVEAVEVKVVGTHEIPRGY